MRILKFEWDNARGDNHNGKHLVIGQHLPKAQNFENTHIEIYGISLDIPDTKKDFQLKRLSCSSINRCSDVQVVSKEEARKTLYSKIDEALDIMFDDSEMVSINRQLNVFEDNDQDEEKES